MEKEIKLQRQNNLLLAMCVFYLCFTIVGLLLNLITGYINFMWIIELAIGSTLVVTLYLSYRKHLKNVMKPLLGALLLFYMYMILRWLFVYIDSQGEVVEYVENKTVKILGIVAQILLFVSAISINIVHYLLNLTHKSKPRLVVINKLLYIVFTIMFAINGICSLIYDSDLLTMIGDLAIVFAHICAINMVVFIDNWLDEYRYERENN